MVRCNDDVIYDVDCIIKRDVFPLTNQPTKPQKIHS